jgi:hypothetical protein
LRSHERHDVPKEFPVPNQNVTLTAAERSVTLPLVEGSQGPSCVDISSLYRETGHFTFDPGFAATASCKSAITFIDGEKGVLLYRGYPIEQLAERSSFLEVAYLLLEGELPTQAEMTKFEHAVTHHTMMHESLKNFLHGFHYDAHPMAMMCASIASLSAFYHDTLDIHDPGQRRLAAVRLLAKMPTIAAASYRYSIGWPVRYPRNNLEYVTRFLHMMFEVPSEPLELSPVAARALDLLFILHADHEQNASTSTVRLVGSTGANPYACVAIYEGDRVARGAGGGEARVEGEVAGVAVEPGNVDRGIAVGAGNDRERAVLAGGGIDQLDGFVGHDGLLVRIAAAHARRRGAADRDAGTRGRAAANARLSHGPCGGKCGRLQHPARTCGRPALETRTPARGRRPGQHGGWRAVPARGAGAVVPRAAPAGYLLP